MGIQTIKANHWLVAQSDLPSYFLHKLIKGKVGIYEDGRKDRHRRSQRRNET